MLKACLNGGLSRTEHPAVPVTPVDLARDAVAAARAGASAFHVHPRRADGRESLAPEHIGAAVSAIRARVPGLPVGVSTGWWIPPGGEARRADIARWSPRPDSAPDFASVNVGEPDWREVAASLTGLGVAWEAGIWSLADLRRFLDGPRPPGCLRILVEMTSDDPAEALAEAHAVLG
ncbi:MAG TPA: 3-keto-5-aminohexanoate cleavage protein, partial [Paracoccaceae bacterium]|nr:3-keto-5-aminohexanoate cleavage protein [Paracoccaceae bacterium]